MKERTSKKRPFDSGKALLITAALVQGVQYAQAFLLVHARLGEYALIGGILAGLVVVGAIAYAGNNLPRVRSKSARRWGTAFFIVSLVISPFVLTPVNWYGMDAGLRQSIGAYAWVLAGLVASLPELALGLVALVDRSLLGIAATQSAKPATQSARSAKSYDAAAMQSAKPATQPAQVYECNVAGCGYSTASRHSFAAHTSHHNRKSRQAGLAGALFEKARKEQQP